MFLWIWMIPMNYSRLSMFIHSVVINMYCTTLWGFLCVGLYTSEILQLVNIIFVYYKKRAMEILICKLNFIINIFFVFPKWFLLYKTKQSKIFFEEFIQLQRMGNEAWKTTQKTWNYCKNGLYNHCARFCLLKAIVAFLKMLASEWVSRVWKIDLQSGS